MAREFVGIKAKTQFRIVYAPMRLTDTWCEKNPDECCDPAPRVDNCCPEDAQPPTIYGAFNGPIGLNGAVCSNTLALNLEAASSPAAWSGESGANLLDECALAQVFARVWCVSTGPLSTDREWYVSGFWVDANEEQIPFGPVLLQDDCEHLFASITVYGQSAMLDVVFDRPCAAAHSYNCVDGSCVSVCGLDGTYATLGECQAACAVVDCCANSREPGLNNSLFLTLIGEETMELVWDDAYYWIGSQELSCGETLHVRYSHDCALEYSCNGETWIPVPVATPIGTVSTCSPVFAWNGLFYFEMDPIGYDIGCDTGGGCGLILGTRLGE